MTPVVSFTPLLAPMPRGILATCTARLAPAAAAGTAAPRGTAGPGAAREALVSAYAGEPFVRVLPEGHWPSTASTVGSNAVQLQAVADPHAGRAVVVSALDNLVKGAARPSDPDRQSHARPARGGRPYRQRSRTMKPAAAATRGTRS